VSRADTLLTFRLIAAAGRSPPPATPSRRRSQSCARRAPGFTPRNRASGTNSATMGWGPPRAARSINHACFRCNYSFRSAGPRQSPGAGSNAPGSLLWGKDASDAGGEILGGGGSSQRGLAFTLTGQNPMPRFQIEAVNAVLVKSLLPGHQWRTSQTAKDFHSMRMRMPLLPSALRRRRWPLWLRHNVTIWFLSERRWGIWTVG
jgi:hypothetical protein